MQPRPLRPERSAFRPPHPDPALTPGQPLAEPPATVRGVLAALRPALCDLYGAREAEAVAERFVEDVCGWSRTDYVMRRDEALPPPLAAQLTAGAGRLAAGEPLQYVLGRAEFLGQVFEVSPAVLIPRPETAELVDWIAADVAAPSASAGAPGAAPLTLLDVGTGSGCIALSLARLIHNSQVVAVDLSTDALAVAERNARRQEVSNIRFAQMDILRAASADGEASYPPLCTARGEAVDKFGILVSNPPYVPLRDADAMCRNVLDFEPHTALFVPDDDPLLFYRAIARYGLRRLQPGVGRVYCEVHAALGRETAALFETEGYAEVTLRCDAEGRDRMLRAVLPQRPAGG